MIRVDEISYGTATAAMRTQVPYRARGWGDAQILEKNNELILPSTVVHKYTEKTSEGATVAVLKIWEKKKE